MPGSARPEPLSAATVSYEEAEQKFEGGKLMRRSTIAWFVLSGIAAVAAAPGAAETWKSSAFSEDRARRFDFWVGAWDVNLRIQQEDASWKDSIAA